jgi:hypothetical protein
MPQKLDVVGSRTLPYRLLDSTGNPDVTGIPTSAIAYLHNPGRDRRPQWPQNYASRAIEANIGLRIGVHVNPRTPPSLGWM